MPQLPPTEPPMIGRGQAPDPAAAQPAAPTLDTLKKNIKDLISNEILLETDREKVYQYAEARKNELYFRGQQYLYPVMRGGLIADWNSTSGTVEYGRTPAERDAQYDYVLNIIRGDGLKFVAVLGQRGPNVKARARCQDSEELMARVRKADKCADYLRTIWEVERTQRQLALSLWKNSTTFLYTPWVTNKEKYGTHEEPNFEMQTQELFPSAYTCSQCGTQSSEATVPDNGPDSLPSCPACHASLFPWNKQPAVTGEVPVQSGVTPYDRGTVECHLATIFEVTVPFYSKDLNEAPWLWYEYEEHKGTLLRAFPSLRARLGSSGEWDGDDSGTSTQGRLSRDTASSPTGAYVAPRRGRWLYQRFWLRPSMYELISNDQSRQEIQNQFPTGVKITMVNGEVVDLTEERLDEVWAMVKPSVSEYIFADPVCKDYMGIQDLVNDLYNITVETMERAIPFLIVDPTLIDVDILSKRSGYPGEFVPARPGVGARLADGMQRAPTASVDPGLINWGDAVQEKGRELIGITPPMFGGGEPSPTAREAEIRKDQALQQLSTVWNEMRSGWAQAFKNGARQLAKYSLPGGENLGDYDQETADFSELLEGGWTFETEEAMPMTWGQKRDILLYILQQGPEAWRLFGLENPMNAGEFHEVLGLSNWKVTNEDDRAKALRIIKLLSQQSPVMGPMGPQPSIPPDQFEDNHDLVVAIVRAWAQTQGAADLREKNPDGYTNVMAWGTAHAQMGGQGGPSGAPGSGGPPSGGPGGPPPGEGAGPSTPITPGAPGPGPSGPPGLAAPPPGLGAPGMNLAAPPSPSPGPQ